MKKSTVRHNKSAILHDASRDKFRVLSSSRSPVKIVNGIKLFNFSDIDSYRMINKPYLNNQKSQMIKMKLDLQKSAQLITNERIKKGHQFVKFNFNPFTQNKNIENVVKDEDQCQPQTRNLVYEISDLKNKKIDRKKHFAEMNNTKEQANKFSYLIRKSSIQQKNSKSVIVLPKSRNIASSDQIFVRRPKQPELTLDQIVKIQQGNAFEGQYKSINLFRVLFHKNQFFKDKKTLDRFKFSFNSIMEKNLSSKIPFYRDLSREARGCVNKKPVKVVENNEEFSRARIKFEDLINVSSGRYTSQYIHQRLNIYDRFNSQEFVQVSGEDVQELIYLSKMTITESKHQELRQIQQFKQLQLSPFQKKYEKICQKRKQIITSNLMKEQQLANASIYDKKMHNQLKKEVHKQLKTFVQSDFKYPKTSKERNRHVRETKEAKNRNEIVKMKKLLETYFLKNENDQLISRLIGNRK